MLTFLSVPELPKYEANLHIRQPTIMILSPRENVYTEPV